ncbi:hypothetical protein HUJ04_004108 [Dendroctonus ponderosae]|nr:hypothetical protein HUJ04_004108 [Dendroctonus ponderosae]KAH1010885.1 hypothetical protein HUJ05_005121 [Dendroctonus ponderosae]
MAGTSVAGCDRMSQMGPANEVIFNLQLPPILVDLFDISSARSSALDQLGKHEGSCSDNPVAMNDVRPNIPQLSRRNL